MREDIPARFHWAAEIMSVAPGDRILEVGCGSGIAAALICSRLSHGQYFGIDKSTSMIGKAIAKNRRYIDECIATFACVDLTHIRSEGMFNKIFCFNVNLFWTRKSIAAEARIISNLLLPGAKIYLFYGPAVPLGFKKITESVKSNLERSGYFLNEPLFDQTVDCCCFMAEERS